MGERAVAKEPRKHSERAGCQHLIDEWLLPFERLRRTATGQRVLACFRIRNLRIELCNGSQPDRAAVVCGVQRLAEHILTAARVVAEVEPVDGAVIRPGDRGQDSLPRCPCIDTANNQVRACRIGSQRILVKVFRVTQQYVESVAPIVLAQVPESGVFPTMAEVERAMIVAAYERSNRRPLEAARLLGIGKTTVYRKLRAMGEAAA